MDMAKKACTADNEKDCMRDAEKATTDANAWASKKTSTYKPSSKPKMSNSSLAGASDTEKTWTEKACTRDTTACAAATETEQNCA